MALLCTVGFLRWREDLLWPAPLLDEAVYLEAFRREAMGLSPYEVEGFLYPAAFAEVGAAGLAALGEGGLLRALRALNLLGACGVLWLSVCGVPWRPAVRFGAAAGALLLSPLLGVGFLHGNFTFAAAALGLGGVALAGRRALASGGLLGASLALKPLLGLAPLLLLAMPAAADARRARAAGVLALACGGLLLLPGGVEGIVGLWGRARGIPEPAHNVSLAHALFCFGLEAPPVVIALAVLAAGAAGIRRLSLAPPARLAFIAGVSLLALPVIWPYTMTLSFPLQALALDHGRRRLAAGARRGRGARPAPGSRRHGLAGRRPATIPPLGELALVAAAIGCLHGSRGVGAAQGFPLPLQGIVTLLPLAALAGLLVYATSSGGSGRRARPGQRPARRSPP